jgi:hypothetical protein
MRRPIYTHHNANLVNSSCVQRLRAKTARGYTLRLKKSMIDDQDIQACICTHLDPRLALSFLQSCLGAVRTILSGMPERFANTV